MREFMRGLRAVSAIFCSLLLVISILPPMTARAAINPQINFQGKLTNPNGTNVTDGTYSIVFSIYTVASGGSAVWTETQGSVSVTDGIFRVALGSVTSLPGSVDFNGASLYLGIKVGADAEMTPRVQFTASPYAFNSDKLGGIAGSGFVQLGQSATAQADASTNSAVFINKTAAGNLIQLQSSATDVFTVSGTGDILFGQNANHTISVSQEATNANGNNLTLSAGQGGAGAGANAGGLLVLQGGAGGGTNGAGGDLTLAGGAASGTGANGAIIVKNPANSANGFQIQNASSALLFVVDSAGNRLYIGNPTADSVGVLLVLDSFNTSATDPAGGVNGAMYYNSADHRYRCYRGINATAGDGQWEDCGTTQIDRSFTVEDEFLFGGTTTGAIGALGWATSTIGGAPAYTYNNATPAVTSNRPGIVRLRTPAVANQGGTMSIGTASTALGAGQTVGTAVAMAAVGANTQVMRVGLHNETTAITAPTTGVWWEYDAAANANWRFCYVNATPATVCAAAGSAPVANTFDTLEIRINSLGVGTSSADFFLNGVKSSVSAITINTTNLVAPAMTCYVSVTAAARDCFMDYFQYSGGSGARR